MSLFQVIQFKCGVDKLTTDEFNTFLISITKLYDKRTFLTKALFFLLLNESKHNNNDSISKINTIIKNIIDQRKRNKSNKTININPNAITNNNSSITTTYMSFKDLPSIMISECASYLTLNEITQFKQCDRNIFISLSSVPTTIVSLKNEWFSKYLANNGYQYERYQIKKIKQFSKVKELCLGTYRIKKYFTKTGTWTTWCWRNLNLFRIQCVFFKHLDQSVKLTQNILSRIYLKHLYLDGSAIASNKIVTKLFEFISTNKNIKHLTLNQMHVPRDVLVDNTISEPCNINIIKTLSKLTGLALLSIEALAIIELLVYVLCNKLESLHIHNILLFNQTYNLWEDNIKHMNFFKLNELCVGYFNIENVNSILKTANNLKKFYFCPRHNVNLQNANDLVINILRDKQLLEYLGVETPFLEPFMQQIIEFSKSNEMIKRKSLIIELRSFSYRNDLGDDVECFENNILNFVDSLNSMVQKDFVLILQCRFPFNMLETMSDKIKILEEKYETFPKIKKTKLVQYIICNKKNSFYGFKPKWQMACKHCHKIYDT